MQRQSKMLKRDFVSRFSTSTKTNKKFFFFLFSKHFVDNCHFNKFECKYRCKWLEFCCSKPLIRHQFPFEKCIQKFIDFGILNLVIICGLIYFLWMQQFVIFWKGRKYTVAHERHSCIIIISIHKSKTFTILCFPTTLSKEKCENLTA